MERYLDPTNDVAFKKVFGTESNKHLLISLLNALLRLKGENEIIDVTILPQEQSPVLREEKKIIFDVRCKDQAGNQYIVEMQNRVVPEFFKRCQFYNSHVYVSQLSKGMPYLNLTPVILLSICNQDLFPEPEYISYHKILNVDNGKQYLKDLSFVFVELQKFNKKETELETLEEKWLFFLKEAHDRQSVPTSLQATPVATAFDVLEQFNWSKEEYDLYIQNKLAVDTELGALQEAKAEGLKEGEEKGKLEEKRAIAKNLIDQGLEIKIVSKATGLSEEQIQAIVKGKN